MGRLHALRSNVCMCECASAWMSVCNDVGGNVTFEMMSVCRDVSDVSEFANEMKSGFLN